jgi:hypothetical protein
MVSKEEIFAVFFLIQRFALHVPLTKPLKSPYQEKNSYSK